MCVMIGKLFDGDYGFFIEYFLVIRKSYVLKLYGLFIEL